MRREVKVTVYKEMHFSEGFVAARERHLDIGRFESTERRVSVSASLCLRVCVFVLREKMVQNRRKKFSKDVLCKYCAGFTVLMVASYLSTCASASSNLAKSLVPDVLSRHYAVNPQSNTVLACGSLVDLRSLNKISHCFISLASTKGYWLNLGDLFDRVLGFDSSSNYFLLTDRQDKFHLLTRDGSVFYPVNNVNDYLNRETFHASVNATATSPVALSLTRAGNSTNYQDNMTIDLLESQWRSQMDFLISNENKPVSVWF